jgi:hypothetical protein
MNTKSKFASAFGKTAAAVLVALVAGLSTAHAYILDEKIGQEDLSNSGAKTELEAIRSFSKPEFGIMDYRHAGAEDIRDSRGLFGIRQ